MPVRMLARPVKTRVEGREMECVSVRDMRRGKRVPKSPRDPEISERGWERRARALWVWIWRMCVRNGIFEWDCAGC